MLTNEIVIDMGYAQTVIALRGKGVVFKEPTVVALSRQGKKVKYYASGFDAKRYMRNRDRDPLAVLIHPVKGGLIEDSDATIGLPFTRALETASKTLKLESNP